MKEGQESRQKQGERQTEGRKAGNSTERETIAVDKALDMTQKKDDDQEGLSNGQKLINGDFIFGMGVLPVTAQGSNLKREPREKGPQYLGPKSSHLF